VLPRLSQFSEGFTFASNDGLICDYQAEFRAPTCLAKSANKPMCICKRAVKQR
jgi:hypothetical protein